MALLLTQILLSQIKAFFLYCFSKNNQNDLYLSSVYLFGKASFRLSERSKQDITIIPKEYIRTLKILVNRKVEYHQEGKNEFCVFDGSFSAEKERREFLKKFKVEPSVFVSRDDLTGHWRRMHLLPHLFFQTVLLLLLLPFTFSSKRANYAMLFRENAELANLSWLLKNLGIKRIYHFCIYEKDANFITHFLKSQGIKTSKIPSEVPLTFANRILICDEICLNFGYQTEELEAYKETIRFNSQCLWIPEMQMNYLHLYDQMHFEIPKYQLGFYSSAFWLRKKLDHSIADLGSYDLEEEVVMFLGKYLMQHPSLQLIVFPHPYEKKSELQLAETREHYRKLFGPATFERVRIADQSTRSTETFHLVNIGISIFSTIAFERLSLGFKTVLAPMDKPDFPLKNSPFRNICAYSMDELFDILNRNLELNKTDFFNLNNIRNYVTPGVNMTFNLKS